MSDSNAGACTTVAKSGVGESGASTLLHHVFSEKIQKLFVLRNVDSSLCGNTGAVAMLVVGGVPAAYGDITEVGSSIQTEVGPGNDVVAIVHTVPLFNDVHCVRLGELSVELDECDLVG